MLPIKVLLAFVVEIVAVAIVNRANDSVLSFAEVKVKVLDVGRRVTAQEEGTCHGDVKCTQGETM